MSGVTWVNERTLRRSFDDAEVADANAAARAVAGEIASFSEIEDAVPAARTLTVTLRPGAEASSALLAALEGDRPLPRPAGGRTHTIAVRYEGEDIARIAMAAGLVVADVVRLHTDAEYTVAFIGFSPGFPYLTGTPRELHAPRLATPRAHVPAGSVAIAGPYTGIYPDATPGGWNLVGRTDHVLFDPRARPPALLQPGDTVRFVEA